MIIVRYADDLIVGFEHETDARRFLDEMRKRLQEFALSLHSEKTRLIEFGRFAVENRKRRGLGKPETFTSWASPLSAAKLVGASSKSSGSPGGIDAGKVASHQTGTATEHSSPIPQQGRWLQQVVTGYFSYHAVPTNSSTLTAFLFHVTNLWRRTLRQRSQKTGRPGSGSSGWPTTGSRNRESFIRGQRVASPLDTQGGSRITRIGSAYGSVRGARGNSRPYRESRRGPAKPTPLTHSGTRSHLPIESLVGPDRTHLPAVRKYSSDEYLIQTNG